MAARKAAGMADLVKRADRFNRQARVRLADQARGCEHDPCDECSSAAIQQDFIKDVGHESLHSRYTLTEP